jgi:hypothetical protein
MTKLSMYLRRMLCNGEEPYEVSTKRDSNFKIRVYV